MVDLISDSDLSISSGDVELIRPPEPEQDSIGAEGRRARRERRSESEPVADAPALEDLGTKPLPALPAKMLGPASASVSRPAVCSNCGGRFVASTKLSSTRCPICEERVSL